MRLTDGLVGPTKRTPRTPPPGCHRYNTPGVLYLRVLYLRVLK